MYWYSIVFISGPIPTQPVEDLSEGRLL